MNVAYHSIIELPIIQLVKVIILPDKWIVAHRGTTKSTISGLVPFFNPHWIFTGIVAADDWVPTAVKYAGIWFLIRVNGFFFDTPPAIENITSI